MEFILHYPSLGRKYLLERMLPSYLTKLLEDFSPRNLTLAPKSRDFWVLSLNTDTNEQLIKNVLAREIGLKYSLSQLTEGLVTRGRVMSKRVGFGLFIDIGLRPKKDALLPLYQLRAHFDKSNEISLQTLRRALGYLTNWPIPVEIKHIQKKPHLQLEVRLDELYLTELKDELSEGYEALNILGATRHEINRALKSSNHFQDVVFIKSHGILEHTLYCAEKTRATGLIPRLGPHLKKAHFAVVHTKSLLE